MRVRFCLSMTCFSSCRKVTNKNRQSVHVASVDRREFFEAESISLGRIFPSFFFQSDGRAVRVSLSKQKSGTGPAGTGIVLPATLACLSSYVSENRSPRYRRPFRYFFPIESSSLRFSSSAFFLRSSAFRCLILQKALHFL